MRIRSIKPAFCTDEELAELDHSVRLHFAMLWMYADDEGRGVDNPKLIKAALWPLDDHVTAETVAEYQDALANQGRLKRYELDGRHYFVIPAFKRHQNPNRPTPSILPPPPDGLTEHAMSAHEQLTSGEERRGEEKEREANARTLWQPTREDITWARNLRPDVNPETEAANFNDYYLNHPMPKNPQATWRRWIRNARPTPTTATRQAKHHEIKPLTDEEIARLTGQEPAA